MLKSLNKSLIAGACVLPLLAGVLAADPLAKSGIIVGASTGFVVDRFRSIERKDLTRQYQPMGYSLGLKAGYAHYFTDLIGVRGYADYSYAATTTTKKYTSQTTSHAAGTNAFGLNADLLLDLLSFGNVNVGTIGGLYLGYASMSDTSGTTKTNSTTTGSSTTTVPSASSSTIKPSGLLVGLNLGAQVAIDNQHYIELVGKVPFTDLTEKKTGGFTTKTRPYSINLGYTYRFSL